MTAMTATVPTAGQSVPEAEHVDLFDEFSLDLRLIEDSLPLTKLNCDTSDGCGASTCNSACTSSNTQPL